MQKLLILIFIGASLSIKANPFQPENYQYSIRKTPSKIIVDGVLTETAWQSTFGITQFWQHFPVDTARSIMPMEVKVLYNDEYIYISAWCKEENTQPVIQNLIRDDGAFWRSDAFSITIDPTNNDQVGYFFGINAGGALQDGTLSQQGLQPNLDMNWNNAWEAAVTYDDKGYYYEMAIPFSAIKYKADITSWGFNFIRNDMKRNVYDLWTKFSSSYNGLDLKYNGNLTFSEGLPENGGKKLEIRPSVSGSSIRNYEDNKDWDLSFNAGLDAKYAVTENINLDMALLPDYSTVEVDKQYIDFYRYEYKVDEKREFFLENNDLFASPGSDEDVTIIPGDAYKIKPFYTRRIGIKDWAHTPILYGGRITGNITNDLRLGVLNMQTKPYDGDLAQNYSAVSIKQTLFGNSSISGLFLNRQSVGSFNNNEGVFKNGLSEYNRNVGLEMDLANKKNTITSSYMFHRSINSESNEKANFFGTEFEYRTERLRSRTTFYKVEENYIADMGYTPRLFHKDALNDTTYRIGYSEASNYSNLMFYPGGRIGFINLISKVNTYFHNDGLNEINGQLAVFFETNKFATFFIGVDYHNYDLLFSNDVLKNEKPLPAGNYKGISFTGSHETSQTNKIVLKTVVRYGDFYNGKRLHTENSLVFKAQPWGVFTLSHNLFKFDLPEFSQNDIYHLLGGRADINFTRDLSWTTLVQYNTQIDNINVNSMLKWRFRPMSDFFIVVKDDTDLVFNQKRFQVVFKLTYWFKV